MLYDTNKVLNSNAEIKPTREDILRKVSEYDIFSKYIGPFKIGMAYKSPLREDKNPSFAIFVSNKDNALLYRDASSGDCGDVFKFVKKLLGLTRYSEVINRISNDLNLQSVQYRIESANWSKLYPAPRLSVRRSEFTQRDVLFWTGFDISLSTLKFYNVHPISSFFVNGILKYYYSKDEPMYMYKVFNKFKIYRPLSPKSEKWRGNLSSLDIQGFEQLPEKGKLLIITKSLKDVMVFYELGYNAIAPASESTVIPKIAMDNIKKRFKKVVVIYDRDKTGMSFARKLVKDYSLSFSFINKKYKKKDISDYTKKFGIQSSAELVKSMVK